MMPIKLYKFGEAWGIADPSPFCLKLESFLREARLPYEAVPFDRKRSFAKSPKGKLPFIEEEDGTVLGDSTLIIERLSRTHDIDLDAPLSDQQRAVSLAFRRMLDEHFYWVAVHFRWFEEPGWSVLRQGFFSHIRWPGRPLIEWLVRRKIAAALRAQGTGRHSLDEIVQLGCDDIRALSRMLASDAYFFGMDRPTLLDIWAYAYIAEIIAPPIDSPLKQSVLAFGNLTDHVKRLQARLYLSLP
jgi:glutathione S-transferase